MSPVAGEINSIQKEQVVMEGKNKKCGFYPHFHNKPAIGVRAGIKKIPV